MVPLFSIRIPRRDLVVHENWHHQSESNDACKLPRKGIALLSSLDRPNHSLYSIVELHKVRHLCDAPRSKGCLYKAGMDDRDVHTRIAKIDSQTLKEATHSSLACAISC